MASMKTGQESPNHEPTLDELMADPMIQLMMQRDRVDMITMMGEMHRVRTSYERVAA